MGKSRPNPSELSSTERHLLCNLLCKINYCFLRCHASSYSDGDFPVIITGSQKVLALTRATITNRVLRSQLTQAGWAFQSIGISLQSQHYGGEICCHCWQKGLLVKTAADKVLESHFPLSVDLRLLSLLFCVSLRP